MSARAQSGRVVKLLSLVVLVFLFACSIELTKEGEKVRLVSPKERDNCTFIAVVTGSMSTGVTSAGDADGAMNETRNKAAQLGANGLRVLNMQSNDSGSTVTAEALKCD